MTEADERENNLDPGRKASLTRREALRRGAIVGGNLLWVAPAIQSLSPPAFAQVGTPPRACYAIKWDPEEEPGEMCEDANGTVFCISPVGNEAGGCEQGVIFTSAPDGSPWTATLPLNCEFINGCSKCGQGAGSECNCETTQVGQTVTFFPCNGGISHIELEFCCD